MTQKSLLQRLVLCCLAGFALLILVGCITENEQENNAQSLTIERIFDDPDLSGPSPRGLKISPDGARVTFLRGKDTDKNQLDLWEYNIAEGSSRMLVDSIALQPTQELLSEEEKSRRERQRISSYHGIVEYQWILLGFVVGGVIGGAAARLVQMTSMPEMVALFNGFGGLASLLVGWASISTATGTFTLVTIVLARS